MKDCERLTYSEKLFDWFGRIISLGHLYAVLASVLHEICWSLKSLPEGHTLSLKHPMAEREKERDRQTLIPFSYTTFENAI